MKRLTCVAATIGAAFLVACGGSGGGSGYTTGPTTNPPGGGTPGGGNSNPNSVTMVNMEFSPNSLTVAKGSTVTWTWPTCDATGGYGYGSDCISHSVMFDDNIQSPVQSSGTFTRTFPTTGTFNYHCGVHGTPMSGKIIVQ